MDAAGRLVDNDARHVLNAAPQVAARMCDNLPPHGSTGQRPPNWVQRRAAMTWMTGAARFDLAACEEIFDGPATRINEASGMDTLTTARLLKAHELIMQAENFLANADEILRPIIINAIERADLSEMEVLLERLPVDYRADLRTAIFQRRSMI